MVRAKAGRGGRGGETALLEDGFPTRNPAGLPLTRSQKVWKTKRMGFVSGV